MNETQGAQNERGRTPRGINYFKGPYYVRWVMGLTPRGGISLESVYRLKGFPMLEIAL